MSKYLQFITSAPIQYEFGGLSIYESFNTVSKGIKNAPLQKNCERCIRESNIDFKKIKIIFTATKGQTYQTGKVIQKIYPQIKIIKTKLLDNIRFKMSDLISRKDFESMTTSKALSIARTNFVGGLFENRFDENIYDIKMRFDELIKLITREDKQLVIGHTFYLKLLEIYIKNPKALLKKSTLILKFQPNNKPYESLKGFKIEI